MKSFYSVYGFHLTNLPGCNIVQNHDYMFTPNCIFEPFLLEIIIVFIYMFLKLLIVKCKCSTVSNQSEHSGISPGDFKPPL